jgi:hypothetical protein
MQASFAPNQTLYGKSAEMLIEEEIAEMLRREEGWKSLRCWEGRRVGKRWGLLKIRGKVKRGESTYQIVNLGNVGRTEDVWNNGQSVVGVISTEEGYQ